MNISCPASPPRLPWLPPRLKEKTVVLVAGVKVWPPTPKTQENQRPARHECTCARDTSDA